MNLRIDLGRGLASMKSEEHQREYMRALGLAMDDGTIGDTQVKP